MIALATASEQASSASANTEGPDPAEDDELNHVVEGGYYGHPNRNRGRTDLRENVYHGPYETGGAGVFDQVMAVLPPSTNGNEGYRAQTFGGSMRGDLILQKWNGPSMRVVLSPDGSVAESVVNLPVSLASLDVVAGPGGVLLGIDFSAGKVVIARPLDSALPAIKVYDIFPWRAPRTGGASFVIAGMGFGSLGNTTVTIDGVPATLSSVSGTRIHGTTAAHPGAPSSLVDVVVTTKGIARSLPRAFRYLP